MEYKVSLIVPVYKVETYIERCVRAIFEQTLSSLQVIFVDDCSPDNSINIVRSTLDQYPDKTAHVLFLENEYNQGASVSRNLGIEYAEGRYIAFCDADDWMEKNTIELMYETIISNQADIVWTDFYYTTLKKNTLQRQVVTEKSESCISALMSEKMHGAVWNKLYKRSLFFENRIFFPEGRDMWEDLYTNIRLFYFAKRIVYLPKAFYHYVQYNSNSIGSSTLGEKKISDIIGNTNAIEHFLRRRQVIALHEKEIFLLKLAAKQTLLFTCDRKSFEQWRDTYPEANKYIMSFRALPIHLRLIGWAATHGIWSIIDLWIFIKCSNKAKL